MRILADQDIPDVVAAFERHGEVQTRAGRTIDRDLWTAEGWKGIRPVIPQQLARARMLRNALNEHPMPSGVHVSVIAGDCVATARRVLMRRDGSFVFYPSELLPGEKKLTNVLFDDGDGTVPISANAAGNAMLVCDGHQGMAADPTVHRTIIRTLRQQP